MKDHDISKWWEEIKKLGYGSSKTEWCEQLMGEAVGLYKGGTSREH